jgi:hypothetical protein
MQMTLRTLPCCDMSLGSLTLHAPEAGDFMELILPHLCKTWQCNELMLDHQLVGSFRRWSFGLWHRVELPMDASVMDEHTASILGVKEQVWNWCHYSNDAVVVALACNEERKQKFLSNDIHSSPTEVTLIYLCVHKQWLSLICHIFLYFLTHTKHTYRPVQWFLTFVSQLLLTHTRFYFPCLLLWWFTTFLATHLHNEIIPPTWSLGPNPSTLKMEAVYSPKTSASAHKTAWDQNHAHHMWENRAMKT